MEAWATKKIEIKIWFKFSKVPSVISLALVALMALGTLGTLGTLVVLGTLGALGKVLKGELMLAEAREFSIWATKGKIRDLK